MNTTDQRRPALLLPLIFPPNFNMTKQKQVKAYIEAFTDAVCDAVFLKKRKSPKMMVELSLLRVQPECNTIQRTIMDKLKKQRGLEQHIQLVIYPFEGTELRPLEFIHSLPSFLAIPCDPTASNSLASIENAIPSCIFSKPIHELMTTPFYQALVDGNLELHPIISSLRSNFQSVYQEAASTAGQVDTIGAPTTQENAVSDALSTACIKGGHRKAKLFLLPFVWGSEKSKTTLKNLQTNIFSSLIDNLIQRYVDVLTSMIDGVQ